MKDKCDKIAWEDFSSEHRELDKKIKKIKWNIEWNQKKFNRIQTRSGLIMESKRLKEITQHEEEHEIREQKVKKYKGKILEYGKH